MHKALSWLCLLLLIALPCSASRETGLYFSGSYSFTLSATAATIVIDRVQNDTGRASPRLEFDLLVCDDSFGFPINNPQSNCTVASLLAGGFVDSLAPGVHDNLRVALTRLAVTDKKYSRVWLRMLSFGATCPQSSCFEDSIMLNRGLIPEEASTNFSDIWWNPNESGWGLTIADHETDLFVVWYTYKQDGSPTWFVISGGTFTQRRRLFTGDVYETTGPRFDGGFNPNNVTVTRVGTARIDFQPAGLAAGVALFTYTIGTVSGSRQIQRQPFGNAPPAWGTDVTDIWWNPNESGWGLTLAQHGNNVFGVWFTYDTTGQPLWVVMPGVTFNGTESFSGPLYTTRGPYFGGAFDGSRLQVTPAGSATIDLQTIHGQRRLRFRPIVFGSAIDKPQLQPMPFANPPPSAPVAAHTVTLAVAGNGLGRVTSSPSGIDCPNQCSASFPAGTTLTLTAIPNSASRTASFTGACSSLASNTCAFIVSASSTVTTTFTLLPAPSTLAITAVTLPDATAGQGYSSRAATATGGQPPHSFLLDTLAAGAPPLGMGIDINGFLTGTPSATYTTSRTFTFGVCVRDQVATLKCTSNTVAVNPPAQPPQASGVLCEGSGTITVTGRLGSFGCQGELPVTTSIRFTMESLIWGRAGSDEAYVEIDKGVWRCGVTGAFNNRAEPLTGIWPFNLQLSAASGGAFTGRGRTDRFAIDLTANGMSVNGTISDAVTSTDGRDYQWSGSFTASCRPR